MDGHTRIKFLLGGYDTMSKKDQERQNVEDIHNKSFFKHKILLSTKYEQGRSMSISVKLYKRINHMFFLNSYIDSILVKL